MVSRGLQFFFSDFCLFIHLFFFIKVSFVLSSAKSQFGGNRFSSNQWGQNQYPQNSFFPNGGFSNPSFPMPSFQPGFPNQFPQNQFAGNQFFSNPQNQFQSNSNNIFYPLRPNQLPQQRPNSNQFNTNRATTTTTTTTAAPFPAALPSQPQPLLDCLSNCITTSEYNPVCGSNGRTYTNDRKLDCANQCGRRLNRNWNGNQSAMNK